jgi:hypothetical protein
MISLFRQKSQSENSSIRKSILKTPSPKKCTTLSPKKVSFKIQEFPFSFRSDSYTIKEGSTPRHQRNI